MGLKEGVKMLNLKCDPPVGMNAGREVRVGG